MNAKFAILLAAKNGEEWISEQIASILAQKDIDLHIYINIDKSDDNTEKIIAEATKFQKNITVLNERKSFGSAAKSFYHLLENIPIHQYDYLCFSDQDDIWSESKLITAYKKIRDGNYLGYSSNVTAFWENGRKVSIKKSQPQQKWDYLFESAGPGCTYVISKFLAESFLELFKNYRSEILSIDVHDWTIYAFSRSRNFRWLIDENDSFVLYRQHEYNALGANLGIKAAKKRLRQIKEGTYSKKVLKLVALFQPNLIPIIKHDDGVRIKKSFILKNFLKLRRRRKDQVLMVVFSIANIL